MRIVHVIPGLYSGGAETVLYRLATGSPEIEHEVICLAARDWYSPLLEEHRIRVHHLDTPSSGRLPRGVRRLHRLIKESKADVVQCWMYRGNLLGGIAGKLAGIPVAWNVRCSSLEPLGLASRTLAYAGGALTRWVPSAVINCSAKSAELHRRWGYGAAENVLIPNGYDAAQFRPDETARARTRSSLGVAQKDFLVGSIARWHPQKGIPVLLRATQMLRGRGIEVRAVLVGRGLDPMNAELIAALQNCGCAGEVQLLGERPDVGDLARALDLHVLASVGSEGFPNVVAETMLSGTPNVVTDIGDSALIVGETGWVVPPADAAALADAIEAAYNQHASGPEKWARRRNFARQRIVENFSLERMIRAYEDVWQKVAGTAVRELE